MEPHMSHDLSLAQYHALDLARTLMVPVTLFEVDGEIGVMPSADYDGDETPSFTNTTLSHTDRLIEPVSPVRDGMPLAPIRAQGRPRRELHSHFCQLRTAPLRAWVFAMAGRLTEKRMEREE
jgi:hypothetical protein